MKTVNHRDTEARLVGFSCVAVSLWLTPFQLYPAANCYKSVRRALLVVLCVALCQPPAFAFSSSVTIDASKVENRVSPLLYGQFIEFMFEGVKGGLHAELLRDRSFEERPNAIGLPRDWERYP